MIQSAFGNLASIPCISNVVAKKHLKLKLNQCFLLQSFKYKAPSTAAKWRKLSPSFGAFLNQKVFVCNQNLNCLYAFHSYVTRTFVPSRTIPEFKKNLPSYSLAITNQLLNSILSWPYPSHLVGDEPEKRGHITTDKSNFLSQASSQACWIKRAIEMV